jgi:hypothetical protein
MTNVDVLIVAALLEEFEAARLGAPGSIGRPDLAELRRTIRS